MILIFKIKNSVWHQFVKEELHLQFLNFLLPKSLFKTIEKLRNASEAARRAECGKSARGRMRKIGPLGDSRESDFVR